MCGIAGWFGPGIVCDVDSLVAALRHRGPDGEGTWLDPKGRGGLVHTRLAILDLSEGGAQPMGRGEQGAWSREQRAKGKEQSERYWITYNGEIYNHRELREELSSEQGPGSREPEVGGQRSEVGSQRSEIRYQKPEDGDQTAAHRTQETLETQSTRNAGNWKSNSDTEVLLRLLICEGKAALPKLAGMFAFAFYDRKSGRALLARDAFGIKPLYYIERDGNMAFASEVKALRLFVSKTKNIATAVRDTLLWGSVPEPATISDGIRQLPAGCFLEWDGAKATVGRWHNLRFSDRSAPVDPVTKTRAALVESIQRHLVSDVPVGIFLSGGIDSTVVLALAREVLGSGADLRTFSVGFEDPAYDESSVARRTANHFGARYTEWRMTPEQGREEIASYIAAMDQPTIDGFNTWCVSKMARREGMKVILSGLGGDEVFGGYGSFRQVPLFLRLHRMLNFLRPVIAAALDRTPVGSRWRRLAAFLSGPGTAMAAFHVQRGIFTETEARELAQSLTGNDPGPAEWAIEGLPDNPADIVSYLELTRYMRNQLLRDSDAFSMAHGLELRVPFVDARLFDALAAIPASVRLRSGKQLLLDAVPEIPAWVRNEPKRGFRFPFEDWMKGKFGNLLAAADEKTTVPLVTWYRRWALAAVMLKLRSGPCYAPRASTAYRESLPGCH
jgi:asparagine synthase (glutamine-hydrolysing)